VPNKLVCGEFEFSCIGVGNFVRSGIVSTGGFDGMIRVGEGEAEGDVVVLGVTEFVTDDENEIELLPLLDSDNEIEGVLVGLFDRDEE